MNKEKKVYFHCTEIDGVATVHKIKFKSTGIIRGKFISDPNKLSKYMIGTDGIGYEFIGVGLYENGELKNISDVKQIFKP